MGLKLFRCVGLLILIGFFFIGCTKKPEIIEEKCSSCHKTSVVYKKHRSAEEWDSLVFGMESRGLKLTSEERKKILDILTTQYGTK
ncbi:MAG: hypothetical protein CSYNP_00686 [Syntrophus sp. SKADARSKE-3]|nr:hypothetical protein [Syntrophus sp. SKADARSKE-3]